MGGVSTTQLGTWANVRDQCEKGRVQPSVLFFESGLGS